MSIKILAGEIEQRKGIHYEFDTSDEPLGEGGTGKVYRGRCVNEQTGQTRDVAIKFLYSDMGEGAIERARREAGIQLRNDNLVEMLGFIELEEMDAMGRPVKRYHVVSELLEGVMLDSLLQGRTTDHDGYEVPFAQKLYGDYQKDAVRFSIIILKSVVSGVMALHDAGYIHRDIDPTNIMITTDGHIKLIDFGIAKQMNSLTTHDRALTNVGQFIGKPMYASPELVLGDIKHQDRTTDIYALGILLFQLAVGRLPFEGDHGKVLQMQVNGKMPLALVSHKSLRKVIGKATEKKQALRYQSAAELRVALEGININEGQTGGNIGGKWKKPKVWIPLVLVACALIAVFVWPRQKTVVEEPEVTPIVVPRTYSDAVGLLKSAASAQEGLRLLDSLVNRNNADATYLKSRLYFKSKSARDLYPDSIRQMQGYAGITPDLSLAHQLLLKTVELNPQDYHALYELGCDYLGGSSRTDAVERNLDMAQEYFTAALEYASGDEYYKELIQDKLNILN